VTSLRRDATVNAGANFVLAGLGVASGSYISYRFGPEGRGVVGVAQVLAAVGAGLGSLGLGDALLYFRASGAAHDRRRVIALALVAAGGAGLVGAALGLVLSVWINGTDVTSFVAFSALTGSATGCFLVPLGVVRGAGHFALWNGARIVAAGWWLASLIITGLDGEVHLLALSVVYGAGLVVLSVALLRGRWEPTGGARTDAPTLRRLLGFGLPAALASAPLLLNARVDQVALSTGASETDLGYYVAAVAYCFAVVPLGQAIANLAATRVAERPEGERAEVVRRLARVGSMVVLLAGGAAWVAAGWAVPLLNGDRFRPAVGITRILLVGASLQALTFIFEDSAKGLRKPGVAMRAELTGLAVMGVLLVFTVPHGLAPTAVASTIGFVASFAVAAVSVSRLTDTSLVSLLRPSLADLRALTGRAAAPSTTVLEEAFDGPTDD
jgi:O-antigen/teichoic acid export membrane protein